MSSTAADLHRQAMALADRALLETLQGRHDAALALYREAFSLERAAAHDALNHQLGEPTISVLHRSAATLALDAQEIREAERLVAMALTHEPPDDIADELRDLLEQIHFRRHLQLRGVQLDAGEFQFALSGPAVGFGIVSSEEFVGRVSTLETMLYRTAERRLQRPYRDSGRRKQSLQDDVAVYVSVPRAASFAVTFRIGLATQLALIPGERPFADEVIDDVLTCLDMLNRREDDSVRRIIKDPAYFVNFVGLAKKIAPDGERITGVGFTAPAEDAVREVALRRPKKDMPTPVPSPAPLPPPVPQGSTVRITGRLGYADELQQHNVIGISPDSGAAPVRVHVQEGMMSDIVKPYWGQRVVIKAVARGADVVLVDIDWAE